MWIRWDNIGDGSQVEEGTVILQLWGPMENGSEGQQCIGSTRGRTEPTITLADGTSRTMLGSNVNCLSTGETERDAVIAFEIDDPYEGEYEVTIEGGSQLEASDTLEFELVESDGVTVAERDTTPTTTPRTRTRADPAAWCWSRCDRHRGAKRFQTP